MLEPSCPLLVEPARRAALKAASQDWPSWDLTPRQSCDLELLLGGAMRPLRGFMARADYDSVCARMRLHTGTLWPLPVVLDVSAEFAARLQPGMAVALRDAEGVMLAALHVEEVWQPDLNAEALAVYGSRDQESAAAFLAMTQPWYVGGRIEGLQMPVHYDFQALRLTSSDGVQLGARPGWQRVIAYQPQAPMHRAAFEMTQRAARALDAKVLLQPVVGAPAAWDRDHYARVRCFEALAAHYGHDGALALLPHWLRGAGPREVLFMAMLAKAYGCTHFLFESAHTPGALLLEHAAELGIETVPFRDLAYVATRDAWLASEETLPGELPEHLTASQLQQRLADAEALPAWFTFPEVAAVLRRWQRPRHQQGVTVFFTGLSGAGKSTVANALLVQLMQRGDRSVTLLDGDLVRKHLSAELGFSREHRNVNVRRIGFVATEITKNGGIAICAPIAPYAGIRRQVREMVTAQGGFVLVWVRTPLAVCEDRDRKGLYAKARAGVLKEFTGISDPYEEPTDAEIELDTTRWSPVEAAQHVMQWLEQAGYLRPVG